MHFHLRSLCSSLQPKISHCPLEEMNTTFPHAYSKAITVLVAMYQNLGAEGFCAVEVDSAAELEVWILRLWLLALSHSCRVSHLVL